MILCIQGEEHPDYSKACVRAHNGAIISLQRSPFFEDVLLSVGDWSCALWKEGQHQAPLFTSPHAPAPYTAACWSPTRPGALPVPAVHCLSCPKHGIEWLHDRRLGISIVTILHTMPMLRLGCFTHMAGSKICVMSADARIGRAGGLIPKGLTLPFCVISLPL